MQGPRGGAAGPFAVHVSQLKAYELRKAEKLREAKEKEQKKQERRARDWKQIQETSGQVPLGQLTRAAASFEQIGGRCKLVTEEEAVRSCSAEEVKEYELKRQAKLQEAKDKELKLRERRARDWKKIEERR
eukprot:g31682.t1